MTTAPDQNEHEAPLGATSPTNAANVDDVDEEGVADLPFARGRSFRCLDDYLAHLEQGGAIDLPWWREVGHGVYERVVRMPGAPRETATRQELMARFGFRC